MYNVKYKFVRVNEKGAAITQWIRLCLPFCRPGFESQAHHLHFYHYSQFVLYLSCEKNEIKQKEAGFEPFKKRNGIVNLTVRIFHFVGFHILAISLSTDIYFYQSGEGR